MSPSENNLRLFPGTTPENQASVPIERLTILLVESDPFHASLAENRIETLSNGGAVVVQVDSLAAALLSIENSGADVVVANPDLSDSQGLETIVLLLQQSLDIPLIVLCEDEDLATEALRFGAQDYLDRERLGTENILRVIRHSRERHALNLRVEQKVRKIESMRRKFRSVVEDNADGMVVVDDNGTVCYANPAAYDLLGRNTESLNGEPFGLPIEGQDTSEVDIVRPDGTPVVTDMRAMRTTWDGQSATIATLRDVTAQKNKESDLRHAKEKASQAWQLKAEFLANMSHELRTPLNSIIGFADLMSLEVHGALGDDRYTDYVSHVRDSGHALLGLVNDLLDLSKAEVGRLELQCRRLDLGLLVDAAFARAAASDGHKHPQFNSDIDRDQVFLWADEARLAQILDCILSNSIKFTSENGRISCSTSILASGGLMLTVSDNGIGMPEEEIPLVFTPFMRAESPETKAEGQGPGLGLVIAKRLVELHDGKITLDSAPGRGTTVSITFPPQRIVDADPRAALTLVRNQ